MKKPAKPGSVFRLRREGGLLGLLMACIGASIGSGWLFGPLYAAQMAGPYAIGSWIIGIAAILLLAIVFAELGPLIPKAGAVVHLANVGNGPIVGNLWSWILFLSYASIAPIEVTALLTYANNYIPVFLVPHTNLVNAEGFWVSVLVLAFIVVLNFMTVQWIFRINSGATLWKILIPLLTAAVFLFSGFHPENFRTGISHGSDSFEGMFAAVATGGVIFSLLGFRHAIDLAGESRNPRRDIPLATIGSVLVTGGIYLVLQAAFIGAVDPADLARTGWLHLNFPGINGPFAALAAAVGAAWLSVVLYLDAFISPAGTALIYTATAARVTLATADTGVFPRILARVNRFGVPWAGLVLLYLVGVLFFLPFPSWQKMVGYIASMTVLSYIIGPVALIQLRKAIPNLERPFTLPMAGVVAPAAFVSGSWIIYWSGVGTLNFMFGTLFVILCLYALWGTIRREPLRTMGWQYMWWIIPYFLVLWAAAWMGPGRLGGLGLITFPEGMVLVALASLVIFRWAVHSSVSDDTMRLYMRSLRSSGAGAP